MVAVQLGDDAREINGERRVDAVDEVREGVWSALGL
jgi:hypothetical protein